MRLGSWAGSEPCRTRLERHQFERALSGWQSVCLSKRSSSSRSRWSMRRRTEREIRKSLRSTCNTRAGKLSIHLVFVRNTSWREGAKNEQEASTSNHTGLANWASHQEKSVEDGLRTGNVGRRTMKASRAQGLTRFVVWRPEMRSAAGAGFLLSMW